MNLQLQESEYSSESATDSRSVQKVSVVCPFFNEAGILESVGKEILAQMNTLPIDWELICVNDGSTDGSEEILQGLFEAEPRARVVGYPRNQGRGFALKTGIDQATGDIIVTTEIDLSWGSDIVSKMIDAFHASPDLDLVIASPHLNGGGYKNVPPKRVLLSKFGNLIIRSFFSPGITMNTGMTRGYRRSVIQALEVSEKGKEFHLEVLLKLQLFGCKIGQIPSILEWKEWKTEGKKTPKRKSSSRIPKLIVSHLRFAVFANPVRYLWFLSLLTGVGSAAFLTAGVYYFLVGRVSIYLGLVGMFLALFSAFFFAFGVLSSQNVRILREIWISDWRSQQ